MKRFFLLTISLFFLAGCSLPWQSHDFAGEMSRHTNAQYDFIENLSKRLGLDFHGRDYGMLRLVASVPALASGSIQSDYTLSRSGRDYEIFSKELVVLFSDLQGPESLSLKNLGLIVSGGNAFMKLDDATGTLLESAITPLISKYRSKWIALSNASLTMSGSSKEEQLAYKFSENLTKLTLKDIRKYSEKYPLWKLTKDNGILNGFYNYEVTLDKDHLKALILDLSNRLTEQTLDAAATSQIDAILAGFDIVGTFRIDTEDLLYGDLTATIIQKSNPDQITFTFAQARDGIRYSLGTGTDKFTGNILFDTSSKKLSLSLNAVSSGAEIGNLDGYIRFDGSKIAESSLSLSSQGLTASFINVNHPDGSFIGKTVLPVGTLDWTGSIQSDTLKNLFVVGQALGGNVSLALTESGNAVKGPLRLVFDSTPVFSADIAMTMKPGLFSLLFDILSPDAPNTKSHLELEITHKQEIDQSIRIESPRDAIPYATFSAEMDTLLPVYVNPDTLLETSGGILPEKTRGGLPR